MVEEQVADHAGTVVDRGPGRLLRVEHLVAEGVEGAGDPGPDPPRSQHDAVRLRRGRQRGLRDAGPAAGEGGVEQGDQVDLVDAGAPRGQPAQGGVAPEADDPHLAVLVDQDVLGREPAVGQAEGVRLGDRVGHLRDQPRGAPRREGPLTGEQDVEGVALAPLVDDVAATVGHLGVEHAQQPSVDHGARRAGGLEERRGALVVGGEHVHGHRAVQHLVVGAPEPSRAVLGEQVVETVAVGEHVTGLHRPHHRSPRSTRSRASGSS